MTCHYKKRMINLLFAGAVAAGTILPLSIDVLAADAKTEQAAPVSFQYTPDMLQYRQSETGDKDETLLLSMVSNAQEELPSLEDYLGKLICTGCGKRCPLTALKCGRGQRYLQEATAAYETMVSESAESVEVIIPQETPEEASATEQEADSSMVSSRESETDSPVISFKRETSSALPEEELLETQIIEESVPGAQAETPEGEYSDIVETVMEYLPLAGLAFGGVYFSMDGIRKKKK